MSCKFSHRLTVSLSGHIVIPIVNTSRSIGLDWCRSPGLVVRLIRGEEGEMRLRRALHFTVRLAKVAVKCLLSGANQPASQSTTTTTTNAPRRNVKRLEYFL